MKKVINKCYDCGKEVGVGEGVFLVYDYKGGDKEIFKCDKCYEEDPSYSEKCSVYSRVVGYMQPVQNYNKGKAQEYKERKTFTI